MAKTIELKFPVKVGELTVERLVLQRPKTKDFIAIGAVNIESPEADALLLASVTGLPLHVIDQIDIEDWAKIRIDIARIWTAYFSGGPYTEDPTEAEPAETPQGRTEETSSVQKKSATVLP
jgi:hypothetical protein